MSRLMTTPNMTVSYAHSLPGSNQSPLAMDQNLSPLYVPVTSIPTQTPHLIHLHGKNVFTRSQEMGSVTPNSSISLGTTPSDNSQQRTSYRLVWLPSPATSLQLYLEIAWFDGSGHLWSDLAHCSALRSPTLTQEGGVNRGWGRGRYHHPFWQQSEQI